MNEPGPIIGGDSYLKEIYTFRRGDRYFGLDVENALFFKMNRETWDVLDALADPEALAARCDPGRVKTVVDSLRQNRFITSHPPQAAPPPVEEIPITAMGVWLYNAAQKKEMSPAVTREAIDHLMREPGDAPPRRLVFIADDFDEEKRINSVAAAVAHAQNRAKEYNKTVTFGMRNHGFSLSPGIVRLARAHDFAVEIVFAPVRWNHEDKEKLRSRAAGLMEILDNIVVTVRPGAALTPSLDLLLRDLWDLGFINVYLDWLCPSCIAGPLREGGPLCEKSPPGGLGGFSNALPMIHTVLTSSKLRYRCRAGVDYAAVSAEGDIHPCHEAAGRASQTPFKLGNVSGGIDAAGRKTILRRTVETRETCRGCGIRYLCGGGPMPADDTGAPDLCGMQKELAQYAMATFHQLNLVQRTGLMNIDRQLKKALPHLWPTTPAAPSEKKQRRLTVNGSSMRPFLAEGDRVMVEPVDAETINIGDIVCFGKPVTCHRVIRKTGKKGRMYVLEKGDNQAMGSYIPIENISGKVTAVTRGDRSLRLDTPGRVLLARVSAAVSLLTHIAATTFSRRRNKTTTWRNY